MSISSFEYIEKILKKNFPLIDEEMTRYIFGIVEDGDFEDINELYEQIGPLLEELATSSDLKMTSDELLEICKKFIEKTSSAETDTNQLLKRMEAPVNIGDLVAAADSSTEKDGTLAKEMDSIWITKVDRETKVDRKKLAKADEKIRLKQEKRAAINTDNSTSGQSATSSHTAYSNLATASQQTNRRYDRMESSGVNRSMDVRIENFDLSYGDKKLLTNANLLVSYGRRYGLCGRNGLGKTTLLRMLASGGLSVPSHIRVLHVEQEVEGDDTPVLTSLLQCDVKREALLAREKMILLKIDSSSTTPTKPSQLAALNAHNDGDKKDESSSSDALGHRRERLRTLSGEGSLSDAEAKELNSIYEELTAIGADEAPAKAATILYGLGFAPDQHLSPTREFSGGWRMRLALARALFAKPDLLLLDEPTNMLDMPAVVWLESYLQSWPSSLIVVSHDRCFLNAVTTDILYLHSQRLDYYKGDYDTFVKSRKDRLINQQKEYEAQMVYREHIQVFINRFRYNANRASQVQSKLKLLEKLPPLIPVEKETTVIWKFTEVEPLAGAALQLDEVSFAYPFSSSTSSSGVVSEISHASADSKSSHSVSDLANRTKVFSNISLNANASSRICIVGKNGAGKTTLLKLLLGELEPTSGLRHAHRSLRIGFFTQHHVDQLGVGHDMNNVNSVQLLASKFPGKSQESYRQILGQFGVSGDLALQSVGSLSGGQKSRVAFAQIAFDSPNMLLLDEPTNHLDVETIEALIKALAKFKGGVMLVSHDQRLIDAVCNEMWLVIDGGVKTIDGGFPEYRSIIERELNEYSQFSLKRTSKRY